MGKKIGNNSSAIHYSHSRFNVLRGTVLKWKIRLHMRVQREEITMFRSIQWWKMSKIEELFQKCSTGGTGTGSNDSHRIHTYNGEVTE